MSRERSGTVEFDPISLEIFWSRLISIADESAAALLRTSFSTIVRESNDFATGLMDANGNSLAENSAGIPSFVGILPRALRHFLTRFPKESWKQGDCIITNDPWMATGHLPDFTLASPIFHRRKLVGFSGSIAHSPDIGGAGWSSDCRELFEEGLRVLPVKFLQEGKINELARDFITANVRVPDQVLGDLFAQVAASEVCARRTSEFLADAEIEDLTALSAALQDRADKAMRRAIAAVPNGTYRASLEADGFDDDETHIECAVTVKDFVAACRLRRHLEADRARAEFGAQLHLCGTRVYPIKCALDPLTPRNEGSYRSVTVDAPEGSILNPRFPAPCSARQLTGHLLAGVIYRALVQAIPDRVIAELGSAPTLRSVYSGVDRQNQSFSQVFFASGGMGGSALQDGHNCTAFPTNTGSGSIEAFESISPLIVWKKALRTDSGGAGKFRGGLGQDVEIEVTSPHPLRLSLLSDRQKYPPEGLLGGDKGAAVEIRLQDGTSPHQKSRSVLQPGDRLTLRFSGGGGYGDPGQRDRKAVEADLRAGYISVEQAYDVYGVQRKADV